MGPTTPPNGVVKSPKPRLASMTNTSKAFNTGLSRVSCMGIRGDIGPVRNTRVILRTLARYGIRGGDYALGRTSRPSPRKVGYRYPYSVLPPYHYLAQIHHGQPHFAMDEKDGAQTKQPTVVNLRFSWRRLSGQTPTTTT
jgi:hypothetical protein